MICITTIFAFVMLIAPPFLLGWLDDDLKTLRKELKKPQAYPRAFRRQDETHLPEWVVKTRREMEKRR